MAENIVVKVTGDATGLKTVKDELVSTGKVTDDLVKKFDNLNDNVKGTEKEFKNLKQQLREAKNEAQMVAQQFGFNSVEAKKAQMKVAELTDEMDDFNNRVKALDPEKKFNAFTTVIGTTAGAFQGLTGMMRLFGGESKETAALVNKLTGVMMFAQGINSLFAMKDALKDIQVVLGITTVATKVNTVANQELAVAETEATVASGALNTSLLANPAFLIIAGIAALGAAMYAMGDDAQKAKVDLEELKDAQDKLKKSADSYAQTQYEYLVATGKMSEEEAQRRKNNDAYNDSLKETNKAIEENNKKIAERVRKMKEEEAQFSSSQAGMSGLKFSGSSAYAERLREVTDLRAANEKLEQSKFAGRLETDLKNRTLDEKEAKRKREENEKAVEEEKRKNDAINKANEQAHKDRLAKAYKQFQEEATLRKLNQQNQVAEAKTEEEKLALQQQFAVKNYTLERDFLTANEGTTTQLKTLWEQYYGVRLGLSNQQDKAVQDSCKKELDAEEKLIQAKIALRLKQENDPVKQAQIEMDALDDKYAKILSNEKLTATERETYNLQYQKEQLDITDKVTKAVVDAEKVKQDAQQKTVDDAQKSAEKRLATEMAIKDAVINAAKEFSSIGLDITKDRLNNEEKELEKQKERGLISEEEYQKKLKEIKRKQDIADKNAAIFRATMDFANALINALKAPTGSIPAVLALTTAIAGANLAKIIATPLPKYQKGTLSVPGVDMGHDSVMAMLQPGEAVIPTALNKKYAPTIRAIYEQKISPKDINDFVRDRKTNNGEILATVDTYALGRVINKNKNVNIENAQSLGKIIANEISYKFNARNLI